MIREFPFGDFLPDAPDHNNPGLTRAENVFATSGGYGPIRAPIPTGVSVSGEVRGAARFDLGDGSPLMVIGTTSDLFVVRDGAVSASGLSLNLPSGEYWSFDQHGFSLYATCPFHGLFRLGSIYTDSTFSANPGNPPRAASLDTVADFLFLGNLTEIDGARQPYRVRWSAFNNPTADWVTDIAKQSGYVDMPSRYGEVTGIFGGRFDLIFQKAAISKIWHTGGPTVFAKQVIEDQRGCPAPNSIVRVGSEVYFLAHDGFCRTDGSGVEVVSSDRVFSWFMDNLAQGYLGRTQGAVDWPNRSIVWSFFPEGFASYHRQIIYNWGLDRWTTAAIPVDWLVESTLTAPSMDETDPLVAGDNILDVDGPSFDSPLYAPRGRALTSIIDGTLHRFEGNPLEATFETGDFQPAPGSRSFIRGVTPIVENPANNAVVSISGRDHQGATKVYSPEVAQGPLNFAPVISDAMHQAVRIKIPTATQWKKASAMQVDYEASGLA